MAQLIVRKLEDSIVRKLKRQAERNGVSMEEEHRRILRDTLLRKQKPGMSFKEFLVAPPYFDDELIQLIAKRRRDKPRSVNLE